MLMKEVQLKEGVKVEKIEEECVTWKDENFKHEVH